MHWLFIVSAIFNFHSNEFLLSHLYRAGECLPRATKRRYSLTGEKRDSKECGSYAYASDRAVFPAAVIIKRGDVTQIYQASAEVSNALYGIKSMFTDELSEIDPQIWTEIFGHIYEDNWFIPIVITNAELNICEFDISNTTLKDGKIEETKFKLETVPWLAFEYPLPYYLQIAEDEDIHSNIPVTSSSYIRKLPILFLNSMKIDELGKRRGWV